MKIRQHFIRHPDGSWEPRLPVSIKTASGEVQLSPGTKFMPGVQFMGIDVAKLCEQDADI